MSQLSPLLDLPTGRLLTEFGTAKAAPGSGCAAALMGLLAANLIVSVTSLTLQKQPVAHRHSELEYLRDRAIEAGSRLKVLFEKDAELFRSVVETRIARDRVTDTQQKRVLTARANRQLKLANDVVLEIAKICEGLYQDAVSTYRAGYKAVSGEAGAAISVAIAAVSTCLFVVSLNSRSSGGMWAKAAAAEAKRLHDILAAMHAEALDFVIESRAETAKVLNLPFELDLSARRPTRAV